MGSIYTAGLRPAATYGAAVNGVSDAEWKPLRRTFMMHRTPNTGDTSLTAKAALFGDPAWTAAVAPATAAATPVKLVTPAPKAVEDPKKDAKKDDKPVDKKNVQTGDVSYEEIPAFHADAAFGGDYKREVPKQYTEMRDDRLMNSLISKYAREVKKDGKLTGQMFLNKEDA